MLKKSLFIISTVFLLSVSGCSAPKDPADIRVGTISGPETKLVEAAQDVAKKQYGINIKIVEFSDYSMPNAALNEGSLDANVFQHQPYLENAIKNKHYDLAVIGKTFIYPVGIYSKTLKNVNQIQSGAKIAIPNDPSNEARALLLLEKSGLIKLRKGIDTNATYLDIVSNPKKLEIKELDAAELPRVLDDVALAVINSNYAVNAGLSPQKNAIFLEDSDSPYANIIVVRKQDENNPKLKALVAALHSEPVLKVSKELFNEGAIPAWKQ